VLTTPPPSWATWQRIVNDTGVRDAPRRDPIPVLARVVWATDGEEHLPGEAIAWTSSEVLVELRDPRCATVGAWLPASDVRRRPDRARLRPSGHAVERVEYAVDELPLSTGGPALERLLAARAKDGWRLRETTVARTLLITFERVSRSTGRPAADDQ
jgi:hypothetical protein